MLEGFRFIGCELSEEYIAIARARIDAVIPKLVSANDNLQSDMFADISHSSPPMANDNRPEVSHG